MEAGLAPDAVAVGGEADALTGDGGIELGEAIEVPVGDRLVEVDPQRLSGLELGGIGRQVNEVDALGDGKAGWAVPAGVVEHEEDDAIPPGTRLSGEERKHVLKVALGNAGGQVPEALPGLGRDKGGDVEPLEAVVPHRDGALAPWRPDAP